MNGRGFKSPFKCIFKSYCCMREGRPRTTKRIRRTDNKREPNFLGNFFTFQKEVGNGRRGTGYTNIFHALAELFPVFGYFNSLNIYTNNANTMLFPDAHFICFDAEIEGSLSAHSRQYSINLALFQYFDDGIYVQRKQVNM